MVNPTEAIAEFNRALLKAICESDLEAIEALTYNNYITLPAGQAAVTGKEATLAVYRNAQEMYSFREEWHPSETLIDGDVGYQRGSYLIHMEPKSGGNSLSTSGTYLNVYRRLADGRWTLALNSFHTGLCSAAPPDPIFR